MTNPKWEIGPVKLANGCDAVIHRFCETRQRYIGEWAGRCGRFYATEWRKSGSNTLLGIGDPMLDLAPPPKKKVRLQRWAVIYSDGSAFFAFDKDEAIKEAKEGGFAFVEINIEVEEGEGL